RKHPQYGHDILDEEGELTEESSIIVSQHHERMDAKGYPLGLSGGDIHPYARICSMVDAYDALTTQRSYKPAKEPFVALQIMKEEMHQQFDPDIFQSFVLLSQRKREQFT
ncbi:MAG: HD-GYP domain-containing protein, partial [Candidatus Sumerlaeota bacterium]